MIDSPTAGQNLLKADTIAGGNYASVDLIMEGRGFVFGSVNHGDGIDLTNILMGRVSDVNVFGHGDTWRGMGIVLPAYNKSRL